MTIHSMRVNYYYCHIELQFIPLLSFLVFNPNSAINSLSTIWTNRHVKHYVFFPIVRFHEKLFFFSLQKIFICRVAKEIAYVRENTPQNIDSIKSYPTSLSGTTFFAINYLESGGRLIHRAPTITPNMSNKHFQTSTHKCFISHPASWKIFFTSHKANFKSSAATKMTGNMFNYLQRYFFIDKIFTYFTLFSGWSGLLMPVSRW